MSEKSFAKYIKARKKITEIEIAGNRLIMKKTDSTQKFLEFLYSKLETAQKKIFKPTDANSTFERKKLPQRVLENTDGSFSNQNIPLFFSKVASSFHILCHKWTDDDQIAILSPPLIKSSGLALPTISEFQKGDTILSLTSSLLEQTDQVISNKDELTIEYTDKLKSQWQIEDFEFDLQIGIEGLHQKENFRNSTPIQIQFAMDENSISYDITFLSNYIQEETLVLFLERFEKIWGLVCKEPDLNISEIDLLIRNERNLIEKHWNQTEKLIHLESSITERVRKFSDSIPKNTAIRDSQKSISYIELEKISNQIANYLIKTGIEKEQIVSVCMHKCADILPIILGIWKAGGAFLPIDPALPTQRIARILEDSNASIIIYDSKHSDNLPSNQIYSIPYDLKKIEISQESEEPPKIKNLSSDLCYAIFTSGTTGNPKCVLLEHKGLINLSEFFEAEFQVSNYDTIIQFSSFSFDAYLWEIIMAITRGATLAVPDSNSILVGESLSHFLLENKITIATLPPSVLTTLQEEKLPDLRLLFSAGESCLASIAQKWSQQLRFINAYGPTETTICATYSEYNFKTDKKPLIGKPLPNTQILILDKYLKLKPPGCPGEICVIGIGLARGYLNENKLSNEKFCAIQLNDIDHTAYRTGDFGEWKKDGSIDFFDRIDNQIKIRGYRVDLEEIKNQIISNKDVSDAYITTIGSEGNKEIAAFVVPNSYSSPIINDKERYPLENGMWILHQNRNETDFMYSEIFSDQSYLKYGIEIQDGDTILDIGSNIGLFSLFAASHGHNIKIHAFEPVIDIFNILKINLSLYAPNSVAHNMAISEKTGETLITFYPEMSGMSSLLADKNEDTTLTRTVFLNQTKERKDLSDINPEETNQYISNKFNSKTQKCSAMNLSDFIEMNSIKTIDLIKLDAEKSELNIVKGIEKHHWSIIRQIVMEVHDHNGSLEIIKKILMENNFDFFIEQPRLFVGTELYIVFGTNRNLKRKSIDTKIQTYNHKSVLRKEFLQQQLSSLLPSYMLPSSIHFIQTFPINRNGKIDKKKLITEINSKQLDFVEPKTEIEYEIRDICSEILNKKNINLKSSFFELGGNSLLATILISRIKKNLNVNLQLREIFICKNLLELADFVSKEQLKSAPIDTIEMILRNIETS
ncbi:hypothetical protein DLM76_12435 [Leptospira yasudae]|uniref:amino acid adenylation domain-containing protein n=1 Tax=Leptospira yasudae TaxID=2202201 RepID=UPI000E59AB41|nr:amino acid adenylation domain-containing protein [Leptospira yasudae]RHX93801.1 hypothetical protein DLM76_12435 [Leptospira yasudae]